MAISLRRDGQAALAVSEIKCSFCKLRLQFAALQHAPVLIRQDRQQELVPQIGLERLPVDIEKRGVSRAGPVFQHVHPPAIARVGHADMIRDKIQHLPHRARAQLCYPGVVIRPCANGRVQPAVIADVVAMETLRARGEVRRRVNIAHPQGVQIGHDPARLRKHKPPIELQPIGAGGNARRMRLHHSRRRPVTFFPAP